MAASRDKILREAEKLVQRGKVEQAIREYEKLLKKNPNDANTINRVGDLYGRVGQIDKAVELYERIADHFTQDGFTTKAIAILKKINRLAPQRLDIFDRLADLYIQQGLLVEARSQFQVLADWYIKKEEFEKAIETHKKLAQLDPQNHMAHLRLADLLMQQGDADAALEVYDRLGMVLLEREKLDEAERLYRHALDQDPPSGEFLAPLCEVFLESGRTTSAREFLHAATQLSPDSHRLQVLEVRTLLAFGENQNALEKGETVLAAQPDDHEVRSLVARSMIASGESDRARDLLLPSCEALLERGEFGVVQKLLKDVMDSLPQDQEVLRLAVRAYRPSGDQETLSKLTAALADSYFLSDDHEHAQRLYMELLEAKPDNDHFRQRLAAIQGVEPDQITIDRPSRESPSVAASAEIGAVPGGPVAIGQGPAEPAPGGAVGRADGFDPTERLAEAKVFAKYGLLEKATSHLEEIIRFFPDEVEARAILVSLYVEQGEKEAALPVARPLYEHYRSIGDREAMEALSGSLPEVEQAVAEVQPEVLGDDVVVLDLDQAVSVEGEPEALRDVAVESMAPAEAAADVVGEPLDADLIIDLDAIDEPASPEVEVEEPSAVEVIEEIEIEPEEDSQPIGFEPLAEEDDIVIVTEEPAEEIAFQPVSVPAGAEVPAESEAAEELVEIRDSFAGPSISDLDQLDFFIEQDLHEDAIRLLGRLESEFPEDPEVAERRLGLKAKGVLLEEVVAVTDEPEPEELFADEEESYVDLAKELEEELAEEEAMVDEATGRGKEEALLEEVFREFQKGVEEQLSESDSDTHFNLGIAYKEMGLLPEAIREFQVASRDSNLFVECCSMIGVCYVEQGMWSEACEWYEKALSADAGLALRYDLAAALESSGDTERAAGLFEEIAATDPSYRDVSNRLSVLAEHRQAT